MLIVFDLDNALANTPPEARANGTPRMLVTDAATTTGYRNDLALPGSPHQLPGRLIAAGHTVAVITHQTPAYASTLCQALAIDHHCLIATGGRPFLAGDPVPYLQAEWPDWLRNDPITTRDRLRYAIDHLRAPRRQTLLIAPTSEKESARTLGVGFHPGPVTHDILDDVLQPPEQRITLPSRPQTALRHLLERAPATPQTRRALQAMVLTSPDIDAATVISGRMTHPHGTLPAALISRYEYDSDPTLRSQLLVWLYAAYRPTHVDNLGMPGTHLAVHTWGQGSAGRLLNTLKNYDYRRGSGPNVQLGMVEIVALHIAATLHYYARNSDRLRAIVPAPASPATLAQPAHASVRIGRRVAELTGHRFAPVICRNSKSDYEIPGRAPDGKHLRTILVEDQTTHGSSIVQSHNALVRAGFEPPLASISYSASWRRMQPRRAIAAIPSGNVLPTVGFPADSVSATQQRPQTGAPTSDDGGRQ